MISATGGQIAFPATAVPSADGNTIDDYYEYTAPSTACTGALTVAAIWKATKIGNVVTLTLPATIQTSPTASSSFTYGALLPVSFRPSAILNSVSARIQDNSAFLAGPGLIQINSTGQIIVTKDGTGIGAFTAGGTGGLPNAVSISWTI